MTTAHLGQWIAENKVIRPLNPWMKLPGTISYEEFESFAKQHTYATDLPDGTYNADDLGEVSWQIRTNKDLVEAGIDKEIKWRDMAENAVKYMIEMPNTNPRFRQFITLKPHPAEEQTPTDYNQQELSFKVAEMLEDIFDIKHNGDHELTNAYEIEGVIRSILDNLGLELIIADRDKFNKTLGDIFP